MRTLTQRHAFNFDGLHDGHYLDERRLGRIVSILISWRRALVQKAEDTFSYIKEEQTLFPDKVDRASQEATLRLEVRAGNREQKLLQKIDATLSHIFDKDFGYCEVCGNEIGLARLEIRPIATQCVTCKTKSELLES